MLAIQQSSTARGIPLPCFSGPAPQSGITPTLKIKLHPTDAGAAQSGTITPSDSSGFAELIPSATDFGTVGYYKIEVSGTGIDTRVIVVMVTAYDPFGNQPADVQAWGGISGGLSSDDAGHPDVNVVNWNNTYPSGPPGLPGNLNLLAIDGSGNVHALDASGNALATASAVSAVNTAILNVQNNTFVSSNIPAILERPDSGSEGVPLVLLFADETGSPHDIDAASLPTVTLVDDASTSLASRISAWTHAATGKYTATYTSSASDALENIHWEVTATVNSKLRRYVVTTQLVDTTAVDFTSSDRTNLNAIVAKLPAGAIGDATDAHVLALGSPMQAGAAVTLAASQPNYAPAKAGDAMALTAPAIASIQSGLATSSMQATINNDVLALPSAAAIATAVRDVDNRTPAANSLGADVLAASEAGGGSGGVTRPVQVIQRNVIVSD